jgi:hypothetical protein
MIFFYRVREYDVRLAVGQRVYLTPWQYQHHYMGLDLKEVGYADPGWQEFICPYERLKVMFGELIGLKTAVTGLLSSGLVPAWERSQAVSLSTPERADWNWQLLRDSTAEVFHQVTGLRFSEFHRYTTQLTQALWEKQSRGGRKERLGVEDCLYLSLKYRQGKETYRALAKAYGLSVSRLYEVIEWVEGIVRLPERGCPGS